MIAPWPQPDEALSDAQAEGRMSLVMDAIRAIRNLRAEMNVPAGKKATVWVKAVADEEQVLMEGKGYICQLAGLEDLRFGDGMPSEGVVSALAGRSELIMPLAGLIDIDRELARLERELQETEAELRRTEGKLANEGFLRRAPEDVVAKERRKQEELSVQCMRLRERLERIKGNQGHLKEKWKNMEATT